MYFAVAALRYVKELKSSGVKKILVSYAMESMCRQTINAKVLEPDDKLIIDSGAFSAWTLGKEINLKKYIEFCHWIISEKPCNEIYFVNLDVIPGKFGKRPTKDDIENSASQGLINYKIMKKAGLKVIPVFHQHEDFKWLEKMMKETDYIGISPANDVSVKQRLNWLKKVFFLLKDDYKTHLFGLTAVSALKIIPAYSADSTSWLASARYGVVTKHTNDLKVKTGRGKDRKFAFDIGMTVDEVENHWPRTRMAIKNTLDLEDNLTRLWDKRGIHYKD